LPATAHERAAGTVRQIAFSRTVETKPGFVSLNELRHPLSDEGARRLMDADADLRAGRLEKGFRKLHLALADPSTRGHARALLGTEYLRQGQLQTALENLTEAVRLLPGSAAIHSNLGSTLCHLGLLLQGENELREALTLDPNMARTLYLLGLVLLDRPANREEAYEHLEFASRSVPGAHLGLAVLYTRDGDFAEANHEIELYGPNGEKVDVLKAWVTQMATTKSTY
jgi:tetratricopeptide (TPR) repeat protein